MTNEQNNTLKEILFYFSFLMVLVYIGIGLMFLFSDFLSDMVKDYRAVIGGAFILYGVFRMYILMRMRKARKMQNMKRNEP